MFVSMRFVLIHRRVMGVLMVFIMNVSMTVKYRFVGMLVHVSFTQMKPNPHAHQTRRHPEGKARCLM